jgi:hypothetical protein
MPPVRVPPHTYAREDENLQSIVINLKSSIGTHSER